MFSERNDIAIYKYHCTRSQIIYFIIYEARYQIKKDYFLVTQTHRYDGRINKIIHLKLET